MIVSHSQSFLGTGVNNSDAFCLNLASRSHSLFNPSDSRAKPGRRLQFSLDWPLYQYDEEEECPSKADKRSEMLEIAPEASTSDLLLIHVGNPLLVALDE